MRLPRASGVLLHPSSLPSPFGIGDLGPSALEFLDFLAEAGQRWWQILPLGPTGYGNSPYQSYSSYAGNPLLVSPEWLAAEGLLSSSELAGYPSLPEDRVDYDSVIIEKTRLLRTAHANFTETPQFLQFRDENAQWLDDYALFMALKDSDGGTAWYERGPGLVDRLGPVLARARDELSEAVSYYQFVQYVFSRQWEDVRKACAERGIGVIGDLPIFVALDSADVWSRPDLFCLDSRGRPTVVAGVPPDYFAATGQLWGNPLYRWETHAAEKFAWWIARLKAQLDRVDLLRLDHFRGFEAYWEVPAGAETAEGGRWAKGPGTAFLEAVRESFGRLPIVAEDLGDITAEVYALRDRFNLPGMRVMQFGLNGQPGTEFHLPYSYINHCLAYTGTHDNDTTVGWFHETPTGTDEQRAFVERQRAFGLRALGSTGEAVHWDGVRATLASVADTVIVPLQDILGLDSSARMNVPGCPEGNWAWRFRRGQVTRQAMERLADMTAVYGRWNGDPPARLGPPRLPAVHTSSPETTPDAMPNSNAPGRARVGHQIASEGNANRDSKAVADPSFFGTRRIGDDKHQILFPQDSGRAVGLFGQRGHWASRTCKVA